MIIKNNLYRGILTIICCLSLLLGYTTNAHAQCTVNTYAQPGSFNSDYVQIYVMTDLSGNILSITTDSGSTTAITTPGNGSYVLYALNYDPNNPPNPLPSVGGIISDVGSVDLGCFDSEFLSDCLLIECICEGDELSVGAEAGSFNSDYTQVYVALDDNNIVVDTSSTGIFNLNPSGPYTIHALNYDSGNVPAPLPLGGGDDFNMIGSTTAGCYNVEDLFSEFICVAFSDACEPECNPENAICLGDSICVTAQPGTFNEDFEQWYLLTDGTGTVIEINTDLTGCFATGEGTNVTISSDYYVYAFNYDPNNPPVPLPTVGDDISEVGTVSLGCFNEDDLLAERCCIIVNEQCCPTVNISEQALTTCDGDDSFDLATALADWQAMMTIAADPNMSAGSLVLSADSLDDASFPTFTPTGIYDGDGCAADVQTWFAAYECDKDQDGQLDSYVYAGKLTLTIYAAPQAPTQIEVTQGETCSFSPVAACGDEDISMIADVDCGTVGEAATVTVTTADGCSADFTVTTPDCDACQATCALAAMLSTDAPFCNDEDNLEYIVSVSGIQGNLSWDNTAAVVDNNDGTFTVTVIPGSTLTVTFTDDITGDCTAMVMIDATNETCKECILTAMLSTDAPICNQNGDLEYIATVSGVQGNLSWDNMANVVDNNDGSFTITITPGNTSTTTFTDDIIGDCTAMVMIDATEESCIDPAVCTLVANLDPSLNPCNDDGNFEYNVMITGVQGNLTWDNMSNVVDNNDGTFTITIAPGAISTTTFTDDFLANCTTDVVIDASDRVCEECPLNVVVDPNLINCSDDGDLQVTVSVSGASGNISLSGLPLSTGNGDYVLNLLPNQIIDIVVIDLDSDCEFILPYIVPEIICVPPLPCNLSASIDADNATCEEDGTLTADITVSGANGVVLINGGVYSPGNGIHTIILQESTLNEIIISDPNGIGVCQDTVYFDATSVLCQPQVCELSATVDDSNIDCIGDNQFIASIVVSGAETDNILINGIPQGGGNGSYFFTFTVGQTESLSVTDPNGVGNCTIFFDYTPAADACEDPTPTCTIVASVDPNSIACNDNNLVDATITVSGANGNISIDGVDQASGNGTYTISVAAGASHTISISETANANCSTSIQIDASEINCPTACTLGLSLDEDSFICDENGGFSAQLTVSGATGNISINGVLQSGGDGAYSVNLTTGTNNTFTITDDTGTTCTAIASFDASNMTCINPGEPPVPTGNCILTATLDPNSFTCADDNSFTGNLTISNAIGLITINGEQFNGNGTYAVTLTTGSNNTFTVVDTGIGDCTTTVNFDTSDLSCTGVEPGNPPTSEPLPCNLAAVIDEGSFSCMNDNQFSATVEISGANGDVLINSTLFPGNGTYTLTLNTGAVNGFIISDPAVQSVCEIELIFDASAYACIGIITGEPPTIDECVFLDAQISPECNAISDTHNVTLEITGGVGPFTISGNQIQTTSEESTYSFQLVDFEDYVIDIEDANGCTFSLSGSFTACITLSLELIEFTGEVLAQGNQLDWLTAAEQQVDYFQLEHSTDGINYELIHQTAAIGTNGNTNQYAYLHEKPVTGLNYYRLVEVDDNGVSTVLQVITLIRTEITNAITNIYPVPVTDLMQIEYNALETGQATVHIYDVKGRLTLSRKAEVKVGNNQISLDLSEFTAGVYLLSIENRGIVSTYKFSKD